MTCGSGKLSDLPKVTQLGTIVKLETGLLPRSGSLT